MKKQGISLIVLVITIIVIIILATAVLVSVISNNPIEEANKARYESDVDNMQAVFTNTVAKIMAQNRGTVNVTAGQINTTTTGEKETTGEVSYTVTDAVVNANSSGKIVFDKNENTDTIFYTGKLLPIYAAGETKWYVDMEGNISLEVAGVKYGDVSNSNEIDVTSLTPGLYDNNYVMLASWDELVNDYNLDATYDYTDSDYNTLHSILSMADNTEKNFCAGYLVLKNDELNSGAILVISNDITKIGSRAFKGCMNLETVVIPSSVTDIGSGAFYTSLIPTAHKLTKIYYSGTATGAPWGAPRATIISE